MEMRLPRISFMTFSPEFTSSVPLNFIEPLTIFPAGMFILQERDSGELVQLVQVLLNLAAQHYANLLPVTVSGVYDAETAAAVRKLQALSALPETGILDRNTWNRLAALINTLQIGI